MLLGFSNLCSYYLVNVFRVGERSGGGWEGDSKCNESGILFVVFGAQSKYILMM